MKHFLKLLVLLACVTIGKSEDTDVKVKDERERLSYVMGVNYAKGLRERNMDLNSEFVLRGFKDGLAAGPFLMSESEIDQVTAKFRAELKSKQEAALASMAQKNKAEGETFLAANRKKTGVLTTPSGLQYKILAEGTGLTPTPADKVLVDYIGTFIDGAEFDNSQKGESPGPKEFVVTNLVAGWKEALLKMPTGSRWQLFVPANLAYGEKGSRKVQPNATLIYEVELLAVGPTFSTLRLPPGYSKKTNSLELITSAAVKRAEASNETSRRANDIGRYQSPRTDQLNSDWIRANADYQRAVRDSSIPNPFPSFQGDYDSIQQRNEAISRRTQIEKEMRARGN